MDTGNSEFSYSYPFESPGCCSSCHLTGFVRFGHSTDLPQYPVPKSRGCSMVAASNGTYESASNIEPRANSSGKGSRDPARSHPTLSAVSLEIPLEKCIELDPPGIKNRTLVNWFPRLSLKE